MSYPFEILPQKQYKAIECDMSDLTLARNYKENGIDSLVNPDTGNIRIQYIAYPTENINDYSTSLLGIFQVPYIQITLTETGSELYNEYCEPDESVEKPLIDIHFYIEKIKKCFYLDIGGLQNIKIIYNYSDRNDYVAKCNIIHTPMKWNYWHFSVRWHLSHSNTYLHEGKSQKWSKKISSTARAALVHFSTIDLKGINVLDENCYKKLPAIIEET